MSRRAFLQNVGTGVGMLGLAPLLLADQANNPLAPKAPHFAPRAKRIIHVFMNGGPSQVDTFDPKPALARLDGSAYRGDTPVGSNGRPVGHLMQSPFLFRRHGRSGLEISNLFGFELVLSALLLALVLGWLIVAVVRFRARPGDTSEPRQVHGHTPLEIAWIVMPEEPYLLQAQAPAGGQQVPNP